MEIKRFPRNPSLSGLEGMKGTLPDLFRNPGIPVVL
jgi:hypothetical protein